MEQLISRHKLLLANLKITFRRDLIDQIHWNERLIGIKGARGVGKTTLVLQYIKEKFGDSKDCLYVNMDDLQFPFKNLIELAEKFVQQGGKYLFIDEIHKQTDWIKQLKNIYDFYSELYVVFTGSSILQLDHSKADLSRRAVMHNMQGLSFREFLQIETKLQFPKYTLKEILENHEKTSYEISSKVKPLKYFANYQQFGYFPYYINNTETYPIKLSELINQIIEYDLPYLVNMDVAHFAKIKRFLHLICRYVPMKLNISNLAAEMEMSRATVTNYLHYLKKADILININSEEKKLKSLSKPEKILLHHPNLYFAIGDKNINIGSIRETFFVNQLSNNHNVELAKDGDFIIDEKYCFEIGGKNKTYHQIANIPNSYIAADDIEFGYENKIPLWLFGFLY